MPSARKRESHLPNRRDVLRGQPRLVWVGARRTDSQHAAAWAADLAGQPKAAGSADRRPASFGRAKSCILLFMWGGPAQQDTWDLKPGAGRDSR